MGERIMNKKNKSYPLTFSPSHCSVSLSVSVSVSLSLSLSLSSPYSFFVPPPPPAFLRRSSSACSAGLTSVPCSPSMYVK